MAGFDDVVGVLGVQFDVEYIDVGESFEQNTLAFHDRLAGQGTDVAESEYCGSVRDNCNQIAFRGVFVCVLRILFDFKTGVGDARRVGETKIALRKTRLGRSNFYLPRP